MLGGHATRIFYMCIAAPRVAFYADSVGAAYTKCAVHLCEMCCRLRAPSAGWPVCTLRGIMRVRLRNCHAFSLLPVRPLAPGPATATAAGGARPKACLDSDESVLSRWCLCDLEFELRGAV